MIKLKLTPIQTAFLKDTTRGAIYEGGRGAGKTYILCMWAIIRALTNRKVCLVAATYPNLRDYVLDTIIQILTKEFKWTKGVEFDYNQSDNTIKFGSVTGRILLRSGDDPDSLRGLNLHDFGMDEARNFKNNQVFLILLGTIRLDDIGQWRICSTTKGKNWVYDLRQDDKNSPYIQTTFDNPFLSKNYINDLTHNYTGTFARQELYAETIENNAGVISPSWFNIIDPIEVQGGARFWDLAVSTKTSADNSSGALCSIKDGRLTIHHIKAGKFAYPDLRKKIIETAYIDSTKINIGVEEAGQMLGFINDLQSLPELSGYTIQGRRPEGDKFNRCMPWAARAESGMVDVVRGSWNQAFFDECASFSADMSHDHDDMIDSVSGAYQMLVDNTAPTLRVLTF